MRTPKKLSDFDAAERVGRLRARLWGGALGLMMGAPAGGFVAGRNDFNIIAGAVIGAVLMGAFVYYGTMWIVSGSAGTFNLINNPSGNTTPYKTDFSHATSLVARGRYEDAAAAYELACIEHPKDPVPYLQLAWLYRDHLQRYDEALTWFLRARAEADLSKAQQLLAIQEIVDLYVNKMRKPRKAIPELVQMTERFPGTPGAEAAALQLKQMREMLNKEREGLAPFTAQFLESMGKKSAAEAAGEIRATAEREGIRAALRDAGGDSAKAAKELGLSPYDLAARIDALGIKGV